MLGWACLLKGSPVASLCLISWTWGQGRRRQTIRSEVGSCNREISECISTDSGFGSECLNFFVGNLQCKHIVLGVCHDGGYKPYLESFASDPLKRDRITLLEGAAIYRSIAAIGFPRTLRLDTVFAPHIAPAPPVLSSTPAGPSSARVFINPSPLSERLGPVLRTGYGQRVDKMLDVDISSPYIDALRRAKLCQWYYLRGKCEGCKNNHVAPPLSAREFDCLWYMARQGLCYKMRKGNSCGDALCVYGHEADCQIGSGRV